MFESLGEYYDEDSNIKLLFREPMDWHEDALLHNVAHYMATSGVLRLPEAWPKDWL